MGIKKLVKHLIALPVILIFFITAILFIWLYYISKNYLLMVSNLIDDFKKYVDNEEVI